MVNYSSAAEEMNAMKEHLGTVTRKGQVTIPADVRRALGLNQGDTVAWVLDGNVAWMRRSTGVLARTAGIIRQYQRGHVPTVEELTEAAEQAIAEDVVKGMGG